MDIATKIRMALAYLGISQAELARRMDMSAPALNQRIKTGKWSDEDFKKISAALGAEFVCSFRFPDGTEI